MLGYAKMFKDRVFAEGRAVGIAEGIAEGKAEGIAEQYRLFREWNRRRIQAERKVRNLPNLYLLQKTL